MDTTITQLQRASQHVSLFFLRMRNSVVESIRQWNISENKGHVELKDATTDKMYINTPMEDTDIQAPMQKIMSSVEPNYIISKEERLPSVTESDNVNNTNSSSAEESPCDETNLKDD